MLEFNEIKYELNYLRQQIGFLKQTIPNALISDATEMYFKEISNTIVRINNQIKEIESKILNGDTNEEN